MRSIASILAERSTVRLAEENPGRVVPKQSNIAIRMDVRVERLFPDQVNPLLVEFDDSDLHRSTGLNDWYPNFNRSATISLGKVQIRISSRRRWILHLYKTKINGPMRA